MGFPARTLKRWNFGMMLWCIAWAISFAAESAWLAGVVMLVLGWGHLELYRYFRDHDNATR